MLHEATFNDAQWPVTSALIEDACATGGNVLVVGQGFGAEAQILFARFCCHGQRREDMEREYFQKYHPCDERLPRLRRLPDSQVVHVSELFTEQELKVSPIYNEVLSRCHAQNGLNVRMDGPHGSRIIWALADPSEPEGWGFAQIHMIERLLPHIRQFVRVRQALVDAEAVNTSLIQMLDNTRVGVIQLDRRGRIVEANDRARDILRRGDGLSDRNGFLSARLPSDNAKFERLLGGALTRFGDQAAGGSITISRASDSTRLTLHVNPVGSPQMDFGGGRIAALMLIIELARTPHIDPHQVAAALALTPAESRVAALLAEGNSVRDIVALTGRKENSVRWHIMRMHRKLDISRQADLVRLVLSVREASGSQRALQQKRRCPSRLGGRPDLTRRATVVHEPWVAPADAAFPAILDGTRTVFEAVRTAVFLRLRASHRLRSTT